MNIDFCKRTPLYIERFALFAANEIGLDRLRGDIHFSYYPTLENDSYGLCWGDNREADIHIASRMSDRKIAKVDKLMTVVHELVHAKQYLKRELKGTHPEGKCMWRGSLIKYDPQCEDTAPWEVEAVSFERPVYQAWLLYKYMQNMRK